MKPFTIQQHVDAKCPWTTPSRESIFTFEELHHYAGNEGLCSGCFDFKNGACPAYKRMKGCVMQDTIKTIPEVPAESVKQEAERRGLSIAEVRRQRRAK